MAISFTSASVQAVNTIRLTYSAYPLTANSAGVFDALNPINYTIIGPNKGKLIVKTVPDHPEMVDLVFTNSLSPGVWTITVSNVQMYDGTVCPTKSITLPISQQLLTATIAQGSTNDGVEGYLRKNISRAFHGRAWNALIAAIAVGERYNLDNARSTYDQQWKSTASGIYLDRQGSDNLIKRPTNVGMSDDLFRQLVIKTANNKLTTESILEVLEIFYGASSIRAICSSTTISPFPLVSGYDLQLLIDGNQTISVIFNSTDFANITSASAIEVASVITRACASAKSNAYAYPFTDPTTGSTSVNIVSSSLGLGSSIIITGGHAQNILRFPQSVTGTLENITTTLGWTLTIPQTGIVRYTQNSGTVANLANVQVGDYFNFFSIGYNSANKGSWAITNVFTSPTLQFVDVANPNGIAETISSSGSPADALFFRPFKSTIYSSVSPVIVSNNGNEIDFTLPATSQAVSRTKNSAAYLQPIKSLSISSIVQTPDGNVTITSPNHGLVVGNQIIVDGVNVSIGIPPINAGNSTTTSSSLGSVCSLITPPTWTNGNARNSSYIAQIPNGVFLFGGAPNGSGAGPAGQFVALSSGTATSTSPDGAAWTAQTIPAGNSSSTGCHNGTVYCVVVGTTNIYTSTNGTSWSTVSVTGGNWLSVTAGAAGFLVATATNGATTHSSDNGVTWTAGGTAITVAGGLPFVVWTGTFFCQINFGSSLAATSTDGITWSVHSGPGGLNWTGLAWNGTILCTSAAQTRTTVTSTDGITWNTNTLVMPSITGNVWQGIAANPATGIFVAVAGQTSVALGNAATSPDGITWTLRSIGANANWKGVVYSAAIGQFCITAQDGGNPSFTNTTLAATSPTGAVWTVQTLSASASWPTVLAVAGSAPLAGLTDAYRYVFANGTTASDGSIPYTYTNPVTAPCPTGMGSSSALAVPSTTKILVSGGIINFTAFSLYSGFYTYDYVANTWLAGPSYTTSRCNSALVYINGKILVIGGNTTATTSSNEITTINSPAFTISSTTSLKLARGNGVMAIAILGGTKALVLGGADSGLTEVVDNTGSVTATSRMSHTHATGASAQLLPDGRVMVIGGTGRGDSSTDSPANTSICEIYDPLTNSWSVTSPTTSPRQFASTFTCSTTNRVYVLGGSGSNTCEYFNINTGKWIPTPWTFSNGTRSISSYIPVNLNGNLFFMYGKDSVNTNNTSEMLIVGSDSFGVGRFNGVVSTITSVPTANTLTYKADTGIYSSGTNGSITVFTAAKSIIPGPYIYDTKGGIAISSIESTLTTTLVKGKSYQSVSVASTSGFPATGYLVFGFATSSSVFPVKYTGILGNTILIDPSFVFTSTVSSGAKVSYLSTRQPFVPINPQSVGSLYLTDSASGRLGAQSSISSMLAGGTNSNITIKYPGDRGLGGEGFTTHGSIKLSDIVGIFGSDDITSDLARARLS